MTELTITLPDNLAEIAQKQRLLAASALETYIRQNARANIDDLEYPPDFPPLRIDCSLGVTGWTPSLIDGEDWMRSGDNDLMLRR